MSNIKGDGTGDITVLIGSLTASELRLGRARGWGERRQRIVMLGKII